MSRQRSQAHPCRLIKYPRVVGAYMRYSLELSYEAPQLALNSSLIL
jgi:hypothetical protein